MHATERRILGIELVLNAAELDNTAPVTTVVIVHFGLQRPEADT